MASLLSMGGGAAEGLDTFLERLLRQQAEERASRMAAETGRHNMAEEGIQSRNLDLMGRYRQDSLDETKRRDQSTASDRLVDNMRASLEQRPIGGDVSTGEYVNERGLGAPEALYKKDPGYVEPSPTGQVSSDPTTGEPTFSGSTPPDKPSTIKFRGTQKQLTDRARVDQTGRSSGQQKAYTLDGEVIDATYDPKTQRVMYQGQDVTDRVEHYEKPAAPYALQTLNESGDPTVKFVNKTPGAEFAARPPAPVMTRMYSARGVVSHIDDIIDEIHEADRRGLIGPIAGRWSDFLAGKVGSTGDAENDALLGSMRADLKLLTSGTVMTHFQSRGGQGMVENFQKLLDSGKMSADQLVSAIGAMRNWLDTYAKNPATTGTGSSADPLGLLKKKP